MPPTPCAVSNAPLAVLPRASWAEDAEHSPASPLTPAAPLHAVGTALPGEEDEARQPAPLGRRRGRKVGDAAVWGDTECPFASGPGRVLFA